MLDKTGKWLLFTNTLAYLESSSTMNKNSFITWTPGDEIIKTFFLRHCHPGQNKLECLSLERLLIYLLVRHRVDPLEGRYYISKYKTRLEPS
jgi:hypothetical protein